MTIQVAQRLFKPRFIAVFGSRQFSTTIDPGEVKHHSQFAHNWWDKSSGPLRPLHSLNDIRIPFIRTGLINLKKLKEEDCDKTDYLKGFKILDVGCGGGILTVPLARLGADITGLDASAELIEVAKKYASINLKPETTVQFVCSSIEDHSLTHREHYDVIVLSEVIEHVSEKEMFLYSCVDTLKPGGSVFITTLNRTYLSWLAAIILAENVLNIVPKGTHEYSKLISQEELKCYLTNAGCKIIQINGMFYYLCSDVWGWVPHQMINYAVHAVKHT